MITLRLCLHWSHHPTREHHSFNWPVTHLPPCRCSWSAQRTLLLLQSRITTPLPDQFNDNRFIAGAPYVHHEDNRRVPLLACPAVLFVGPHLPQVKCLVVTLRPFAGDGVVTRLPMATSYLLLTSFNTVDAEPGSIPGTTAANVGPNQPIAQRNTESSPSTTLRVCIPN